VTRREVRVLAGAEELARATAEEFSARARAAAALGRDFTVALAGGSTPERAYGLLSAGLPWQSIHLFWGDERHVPPDHADSNYRMVKETLLDRVRVEAANVHRARGEAADAAEAARGYERDLRAYFEPRGLLLGGFPRFDLVLLGMGADGHTASLFPGTDALEETTRWVAAPWVEKLKAHRITLTFPVLAAAECVLFAAGGADKAAALARVLHEQPPALPAGRVRPRDGELIWLVDRAAAGEA